MLNSVTAGFDFGVEAGQDGWYRYLGAVNRDGYYYIITASRFDLHVGESVQKTGPIVFDPVIQQGVHAQGRTESVAIPAASRAELPPGSGPDHADDGSLFQLDSRRR